MVPGETRPVPLTCKMRLCWSTSDYECGTACSPHLARMLADDLSGLLSGDRLDVSVSEPEMLTGGAAFARIGPIAANSLLRCGASGETALLSFDFATAIALTDRSFGGDGKSAPHAPDQLPRSAALLADEAAAMIAGAITRASYGDAPLPTGPRTGGRTGARTGPQSRATKGALQTGEVIVRSESAGRLKPFEPDAPAALITLIIANQQGCEWCAVLAIAAERMERLLPQPGMAPRRLATARTSATGLAAPFAAVPLPLHAVLAEFDLSLARLQTLSPGDTIPLAMGRQVPLMIGERLLGHGSIGTQEDRMAIRLTRFPASAQGAFR